MSEKTDSAYTPKQKRGQQRVDLILDAASQIIAEVGYEAATTILIAERAKTSVGSLYQFFPNKDAIVRALVARYVATWREQAGAINFEGFKALTVEEMGDQFVEPLREFVRHNRDFNVLFASSHTSKALSEAIGEADEAVLARNDAVMAYFRPDLSASERRRYALICMHTIKGLLALVAYSDEVTLDEVFDEMKAMLNRYLAPLMVKP